MQDLQFSALREFNGLASGLLLRAGPPDFGLHDASARQKADAGAQH
jgi:hypothetical protein